MFDGELVGIDDGVAVDVGDGHLGSGYHVEAVKGYGVHLSLFVGQLAGAQAGGLVDHQRGLYLQVAGIGGTVEEEVDEGSLQACTFAFVHRETGTGNLVAQLEVHKVVFGTEVPMW